MKRVYIASPCRGNGNGGVDTYQRYLKQCLEHSISLGEAPYAPHAYLPKLVGCNDNVEAERRKGLDIGLKFLVVCNLLAIYTDYDITEGMQAEWDYAKAHKIPYVIRKIQL